MATFKMEVQNKRADGTYNVRIRITHRQQTLRLSTPIFVKDSDLTRGKKIKNPNILTKCAYIIEQCYNCCKEIGFPVNNMQVGEVRDAVRRYLEGSERFRLDFIQFSLEKIKGIKKGPHRNYSATISALRRYINRDYLDIAEIDLNFLKGFRDFIQEEPSQRGKKLKPKGGRAVSLYLSCLRALHGWAKDDFNNEDQNLIRIPNSPFRKLEIKQPLRSRKRSLSVEEIQKIINLPYRPERGRSRWSRFNLAKDCFIMSFVMLGINSVDMYQAAGPVKGVLTYNRAKTKDRRDDKAEMRVKLDKSINRLLLKYKDNTRLFNFHRHYSGPENFNTALNAGLKEIARELSIPIELDFYAARHSWATIARSSAAGIDKATVHEALNHIDQAFKVTDVYIEKDWSIIWNANEKVLDLFDWSAIGYDLL